MQILVLYFTTALFFLGLDAIMLKNVMRPLFETRISSLLLDDLRLVPAAIFYLFYVGGLVWFVSIPALKGQSFQAFTNGALLGAMAYGTYEFTNYATLRAWGTLLTGSAALVGVLITNWLFRTTG